MAEFAAAFNTIVGVASSIQQLGESYYEASAEYDNLSQRLDRLKRKGGAWVKEFTDCGISDEDLIKIMNEAISVLEKEEKKLSNEGKVRRGNIFASVTRCCAKAHVVAFPIEIRLRIEGVSEAIDAIQDLVDSKQKAKDAAEQSLYNRSHSLRFSNDDRYVPLDDTEQKIYFQLENSSGRIVVLLYGGPGRGKSSLARNVALHYKQIKKEELQVTKCTLFEQVVFLECGLEAKISSQQQRLLQQLGLSKISSLEDQQGTVDFFQLLKGALKSRKILIILDDVWDAILLQEMINVCGDNVKCLVTSQKGDLCSHLSCPSIAKIQIQDISQEVGRKILASHVRFPNQHIPNKQILGIVDKMISDTTGNPLALASVVSAIQEDENDSLEVWEEAYSDLQESLKANVRPEDRPHLFGQGYPQSFWAATKLSIHSLRKEAQSLLILMALCKGPSVPEEVIRFLFGRTNLLGEGVTFRTLKNELKGRELVKINDTFTDDNDHFEKSWSTHGLHKLFMDEDKEMRVQKGRMFESVLGLASTVDTNPRVQFDFSTESLQEVDAAVTRVLSALYFEDQFAKKVSLQLGFVDDTVIQRRQAFEPITRLLGKPLREGWTIVTQTAVKQVFVKYFCDYQLDDKNISLLLKMTASPVAQLATLDTIAEIELVEGAPMLIEDSTIVTDLVTCLRNPNAPILQRKAAYALWALSGKQKSNKLKVLNGEGALETLVTCLVDDDNPTLQKLAVQTFMRLANDWDTGLEDIILRKEGVLEGLLHCLSNHDNPDLQDKTARALANLACGGEFAKLKILTHEGVLTRVVKSLAKDENPGLQREAACTLMNLSCGPDWVANRILKEEGALEGLVHSLSGHDSPVLQQRAVTALANIASVGVDSAKLQVLTQEGALVGLVGCLSKDDSPKVQLSAARALTRLADGPQSSKLKILKEEGALAGLVKSASKHENPALQKEARWALTNLVAGGEEMRLQLLGENEELTHLVNFVFEGYKPDL